MAVVETVPSVVVGTLSPVRVVVGGMSVQTKLTLFIIGTMHDVAGRLLPQAFTANVNDIGVDNGRVCTDEDMMDPNRAR